MDGGENRRARSDHWSKWDVGAEVREGLVLLHSAGDGRQPSDTITHGAREQQGKSARSHTLTEETCGSSSMSPHLRKGQKQVREEKVREEQGRVGQGRAVQVGIRLRTIRDIREMGTRNSVCVGWVRQDG